MGNFTQLTARVAAGVRVALLDLDRRVRENAASFASYLPLAGGTLSGVLLLPDGSAAAPSLANDGDADTGLSWPTADQVDVVTGGTRRFRAYSGGLLVGDSATTGQALAQDGTSASSPPWSFYGDADTGLFRAAADAISVALGGAAKFKLSGSSVQDGSNRHFLRTDTGRSSIQMVQFGTASGTTDANGDLSVSFTESFTAAPFVVAMEHGTFTGIRSCTVNSNTASSFKVRVASSTGALASASVSVDWIAVGAKTDA